tara:strand:- start:887 stop:1093 length:207 start_codon:yes stop_codon:yes gene_type:complete
MSNKEIAKYIILIIVCICLIIYGIDSFKKEYSEAEKNTKIQGRWSFYEAIVALILVLFLLYEDIKKYI